MPTILLANAVMYALGHQMSRISAALSLRARFRSDAPIGNMSLQNPLHDTRNTTRAALVQGGGLAPARDGTAGVTLFVQPAQPGTQQPGRHPLRVGRLAAEAFAKELQRLHQVLAIGLDGIGGGVLLQGQVSQKLGESFFHKARLNSW